LPVLDSEFFAQSEVAGGWRATWFTCGFVVSLISAMAIGITKEACIASLRVKLLAFAELYAQDDPSGTFSGVIRAHAELASTSTNLTFLRRFSAEADVVLRETLEAEALVKFAEELSRRGVNDLHIPKLPSVRRLRFILKSGVVKNEEQLSLVRSALDSNTYGQLEPEELVRLGQMFDEYTCK
jgi:hypothetical protein